MAGSEQRWWTVGTLAQAAGVTVRALHHYDRLGLLTASGRTSGGHRRYTEPDVARLYRILALRSLGIALDELPELLEAEDPAPLLATARSQRERAEQQLNHSALLRSRLNAVISKLELDPTPPITDLLDTLETMAVTVHLTRIYTRLGDDGQTDLADRTRIAKTDSRVEAVGAVDELNATVGLALAAGGLPDPYTGWLQQIQNDLFDLGADLARPTPATEEAPHLQVDQSYVSWLERRCDDANADLPALDSFVLPGGTLPAAHLHLCRTVCRRAERRALAVPATNPAIIRYLNRLSDLLFILSRAANPVEQESLWRPGRRTA